MEDSLAPFVGSHHHCHLLCFFAAAAWQLSPHSHPTSPPRRKPRKLHAAAIAAGPATARRQRHGPSTPQSTAIPRAANTRRARDRNLHRETRRSHPHYRPPISRQNLLSHLFRTSRRHPRREPQIRHHQHSQSQRTNHHPRNPRRAHHRKNHSRRPRLRSPRHLPHRNHGRQRSRAPHHPHWREVGGNAVVFDIKDSDGSVNIPFEHPLLGQHQVYIHDVPKFVHFLHQQTCTPSPASPSSATSAWW